MEEQFYRNISMMIDEAIDGYEELLELYKEKKQALIKQDKEMLAFVDNKILNSARHIETLNTTRENYCKDNDVMPVRITELIDMASKEYPEFEEVYKDQKVKISKVAHDLALIDKTNVELIKHSLVMSDKLLDIIISAATPQKDNYDMHGKNIDTTELGISSIVEDA